MQGQPSTVPVVQGTVVIGPEGICQGLIGGRSLTGAATQRNYDEERASVQQKLQQATATKTGGMVCTRPFKSYGDQVALEVATAYMAIWDRNPALSEAARPVSAGFPRGTVLGPIEDVAHYEEGVACKITVEAGNLPSDYTGTIRTGKVEIWVIVWSCTLNAEHQ